MSGTRTVQQPLDTRNFLVVLAMAAIVLAATVAIAWSAANLAKTAPGAAPAPAALTAPAVRDLGSRDLGSTAAKGLANNPVHDLGSRDTGAASVSIGATNGAPGAYRPAITSGGSATIVKDDIAITSNAQTGFLPGYLGYADQLRLQGIFSSEGAPATRHAGPRAQ